MVHSGDPDLDHVIRVNWQMTRGVRISTPSSVFKSLTLSSSTLKWVNSAILTLLDVVEKDARAEPP